MKYIIKKWYIKLAFPKIYDGIFEKALDDFNVSLPTNFNDYDDKAHSAEENFLAYLYYCESLQKWYQNKCVPNDILMATLSDIVIWTNVWYSIHGELGIGETEWLRRHLSARLFRLGRLQFCFGNFDKDYTIISANKGDSLIEIHIPEDGKLSSDECDKSFVLAENFYAKYFKDYEFKFYTCHSWLLDKGLEKYLGDKSNVTLFRRRFKEIESEVSDAILRYVFRWDATRDNIDKFETKTKFSQAIKQSVKNNEKFFETFGIVFRNN